MFLPLQYVTCKEESQEAKPSAPEGYDELDKDQETRAVTSLTDGAGVCMRLNNTVCCSLVKGRHSQHKIRA